MHFANSFCEIMLLPSSSNLSSSLRMDSLIRATAAASRSFAETAETISQTKPMSMFITMIELSKMKTMKMKVHI